MCVFFVKQKRVYEMRSSDWRSDVCSPDLNPFGLSLSKHRPSSCVARKKERPFDKLSPNGPYLGLAAPIPAWRATRARYVRGRRRSHTPRGLLHRQGQAPAPPPARRSEEHTSELQSLMRNSYAVFCLKKKKSHEISTGDDKREEEIGEV